MAFLEAGCSQMMEGGDRSGSDGVVADRLVERHFAMQDGYTGEMSHVEVMALDPMLRSLLFTDGTVTRALEAQTLRRAAVEVVEQSHASPSPRTARLLDVSNCSRCVRRRITMRTLDSAPSVWAESHILPERLPIGFLNRLDGTPHGIGGYIEQSRLESRRELLWFRLGSPPRWASEIPSSARALVRLYRIITNDRPALLICEAFAVERRLDIYRLVDWSEARADVANGSALSALK
jgi:chorismate-pyruvate lyase